ncbi:Ig-like domain-containing protein, partial [Acinetobacter baumannii]|uniref:Ig-like domain-containing protein n=1 Tax=Acinetobacter baumannii TaxID=470 RepID=UPI000AFA8351
TVTVDTTAPVLTISTSDLVLASGEAATITFEFSEPVSEFSVSDVVVSGGVLSNFIQVDANTWTAIFTQSGSVAPSISVADGAYTDIVGNTGKGDVLDGADGFIFNPLAVDLIGEITIPADINNDNILNANELGADKTFTAQITLGSDAAVGNIISVNGINYTVVQADLDAGFITAEIIVTVDGDLSVRAEARDSAGNTDIADTTIKVITVDTTAPITPSAPTGYLDNVGPDQGIKGSGSSTDDTTPGVVISAPGAGETPTLYVDGEKVAASYDPVTGTLTPTTPLADGSHQLTYTLTDAAGNESAQSPAMILTVDTTAPSLVITALDPALTATESTTISFTFSEAVSGFDIDDITPVGGTLSNLVQSTTNPNVWTATFTADGSGAAPSISVADGAYTDLAGNLGTGDVLDGTDGFVVDTLAPAPVITIDPVTNAITIDFGEAVNAVDGSPLTADALEGLLDIANGKLTDLVDNGDGSFSGTLVPAADFEGDVVVNVPAGIVTDVAGNANLTATESLTVDTLAPGLVITALDPALTATESTTISFTFSEAVSGFDIDDITPVGGTLSNLVQSTTNPNVWTATFTQDGTLTAPSISVADDAYTDLAGNLGKGDVFDGTDGFVVNTIDAINDNVTFDPGTFVSTIWDAPIIAQDINVLDTSIIGDTSMNVEFSVPRNSADIGTGHEGDVVIQVSQDNLIAVASGFSVLVEYFDGANWVQYTTATTTNGGLIADALGLGVLGIVDDGKTIAVHLTGVPEGQYRVVVQNDSSAIGDLLDDLTLAQLGDQGILLGADNQDAVLDAVETALNGQVLNLGTLVRNVLEPLLNIANAAGETLAVTDIVAAIVKIPLVGSLLGGVDTVLDYIADALVDNLLSVLEFTNVTINGSETYYTTPQVSGNVFDDNGSGADDRGNSDAALVTKVDGVDVPTDGTDAVIKGLYGTLYINKDGVYRYVLNGSVDSNGQVDDFTYTLSDGTHSDTAVLTISVADVIAPKAPIVSSLDETTVTGVAGAAEANSVINVYGGTDSDGDGIPDTLLGTTTANPDGSYTVTLNPAIALGDTVVVTSKDAAGNISTPTIASLHNIVALDDPNQTNYELSTTADRPNISGGIFTLANAGVLGDLIDLDLSATSAPGVTVGTNEQITLTLTASGSTGLDISAVGNLIDAILGGNIGGSLDLIIAKQTSTGSYEVYNTIANAYTLNNNVLTFTASGSQSISLDDAGVYKFILAPNSSTSSALSNLLSLNLLGNLILSSNDVVAT